MSPLRWVLFLVLSVRFAHGSKSFIDYLRANISEEWNEDLEPVLEKMMKRLRKDLFPVLQEILYDDEMDGECLQSLARFSSGLNDQRLWALKLIDANGRPAPGVLEGQSIAFGNYDECLGIRVPDRYDAEKIAFGGQYCTVGISIHRQPLVYRMMPDIVSQDPVFERFFGDGNRTWMTELMERSPFGFRLGICLPSTCNSSIIPHFAKKFAGKYGIEADVLACKDQLSETPMPLATLISLIAIGTMLGLVVIGTTVESFCGDDDSKVYADKVLTLRTLLSWTTVVRLIKCFSARAAYMKVVSAPVAPELKHLDCMHGVRVLSSFWILYGHTFGGDPGNYDSIRAALVSMRSPAFSIIIQSLLAVETFFTMTGILIYIGLKIGRTRDPLPTPWFALSVILRRAIRLLVPALGALFIFFLFPLITSGPALDYFYTFLRKNCEERWWTIPLFINNFWPLEQACVGSQWYNAVDMQCLLILIIPVLIMVRKPTHGIFLVTLLIGVSIIYTTALTVATGALPTFLLLPRDIIGIVQLVLRIHDRCLVHLASVAVGILGGYLIHNHRNAELSRTFTTIGWVVFACVSSSVLFGIHVWHERGSITVIERILYSGLFRPLWSMCVVWIVYMCAAGRAQTIRWLLSRPNLMILSRLSYCFYLMQMHAVLLKMFTARHLVPFTYYQNFRDYFADLIFDYLAAIVLVVLFEAPTAALDKLIYGEIMKYFLPKYLERKAKAVKDKKIEDHFVVHYKL